MINKLSVAIVLLTALALTGCSTYSDLRSEPPAYSASSTKAPQTVADCALVKWSDFNAASHIVHDGGATVVAAPVGGGTPNLMQAMLIVTPDGAGSHVEMKHMPSLGTFASQWRAAESCL